EALGPVIEVVRVQTLNRDVVAAAANAAANLERRGKLDERAKTWKPQQLWPKFLRDLLGGHWPLPARHEVHHQARRVHGVVEPVSPAASRGHEAVDVRTLADDFGDSLRGRSHLIERRPLRRAQLNVHRV